MSAARPRYVVDPDRSTLMIEAHSNVGIIRWECHEIAGEIAGELAAEIADQVVAEQSDVSLDQSAAAWLEVDLEGMSSGNAIYDGQLRRHLDTRHHPVARLELEWLDAIRPGRFAVRGRLDLRGSSGPIAGVIELERPQDDELLATGRQEIDIRDFGLPVPTMMMLKIYPGVTAFLVAVLRAEG